MRQAVANMLTTGKCKPRDRKKNVFFSRGFSEENIEVSEAHEKASLIHTVPPPTEEETVFWRVG